MIRACSLKRTKGVMRNPGKPCVPISAMLERLLIATPQLRRIADMLPKHWGEPVGGGEAGEQLAAKQLSHNSLLLILSQAGILPQLLAPVLR